MRCTNASVTIIVLMLWFSYASAQGPVHHYAWASQDTLKIACKDILINNGYKPSKIEWNKKRVIGTAAMITFGVLAYYCHQQSESAYNRYLRSGSIQHMNRLFRQTERYDKLKGAATIGIEMGFLINLWSFL